MEISHDDIQELRQDSDGLFKLACLLGYRRSFASDADVVCDFFEDNPGAVKAVFAWVVKNYNIVDVDVDDESEEEEP